MLHSLLCILVVGLIIRIAPVLFVFVLLVIALCIGLSLYRDNHMKEQAAYQDTIQDTYIQPPRQPIAFPDLPEGVTCPLLFPVDSKLFSRCIASCQDRVFCAL